MKNISANLNNLCLILALSGAIMFSHFSVKGQIVTASVNSNLPSEEVTIKTSLTVPIDPTGPDHETSVGFFYRLENIYNPEQSYFWSAVIQNDADDSKEYITETLKLPAGTYTVIAYEYRKSRPVRSTKLSGTTNTFTINTSNFQFPEINIGASELKIFSSWNINWHEFPPYSSLRPEHYTKPPGPEYLPATTEPWVFMTLVKKDWITPGAITITFPDFLSFGGAIVGNDMNDVLKIKNIKTTVTPKSPNVPQSVSISNNSPLASEQVIIHLIFKKNGSYIPSEPYPETASFTAFYYIPSQSPTELIQVDTTFVFKPKPKPHDPNRLTVDKKELCECGSYEYLTYRIDYQNDGEAPVDTVFVTLMDLNHLQKASIKHNIDTDGWRAPINDNLNFPLQENEFLIDYKGSSPRGMPGLKQNSISYPKPSAEACQDYFHITVRKDDCLSAGEKIQPKAMITFSGTTDTIYTNLDETLIVDRTNCKPCPPNIKCPNCSKKKPCWLFAWFRKKNNT